MQSGIPQHEKVSRVGQALQNMALHIRLHHKNFRGPTCVKFVLFNFGHTGDSILPLIASEQQNTTTA